MASSSTPSSASTSPPGLGRIRSTRQAGLIEAALLSADGFRTAHELFARLREQGEGIGLTTVYRYLNLLAEQGRADVVRSADGEAQFRLCGTAHHASEEAAHHHHVVCRECGRSVEVTGPEVEAWAERVAIAAGFTEITHTVEVFGLCAEHSGPLRRSARRGSAT